MENPREFQNIIIKPIQKHGEIGLIGRAFFPNGLGVSILKYPQDIQYYGGWEIQILKGSEKSWRTFILEGINDSCGSPLECLDPDDITQIMRLVSDLPKDYIEDDIIQEDYDEYSDY